MTAGELRERVRFERRVQRADDSYGNITYEWRAVSVPMAANLEPASGQEGFDEQLLRGEAPFTVTVRSSEQSRGIITNDRIVNLRTGETFDIKAIANPDQRRRYLAMMAVRGGAEA